MKDYLSKNDRLIPSSASERSATVVFYIMALFSMIFMPLLIVALNRQSSFVVQSAKNYFNFIISYFIYLIASLIAATALSSILKLINLEALGDFILALPMFLMLVLIILRYIFTIICCYKAYQGNNYQPPYTLRLIK